MKTAILTAMAFASALTSGGGCSPILEYDRAALESASKYNFPMEGDSELSDGTDACFELANPMSPAISWSFNGADTGYRFNGTKWENNICEDGQVRLQPYAPIVINGKLMYMQRGGGRETSQDCEAIRHGFILKADLAVPPTSDQLRETSNGKSCPETDTIYYNNPEGSRGTIPDDMWYKGPDPKEKRSNKYSKWLNYGDPPQTQGNTHIGHYNYLLWNWMWDWDTGGGQIRAVLRKNETIRRCNVESIISYAYDETGKKRVGEVRGIYGKVSNSDGSVVYGWVVHSWRRSGGDWSFLLSETKVPESSQGAWTGNHCPGSQQPCGSLAQICCNNSQCGTADLVCSAGGTCQRCGGQNQACCLGGGCSASGLTCSGGSCQPSCGGRGEACCPGGGCNVSGDTCAAGVCQPPAPTNACYVQCSSCNTNWPQHNPGWMTEAQCLGQGYFCGSREVARIGWGASWISEPKYACYVRCANASGTLFNQGYRTIGDCRNQFPVCESLGKVARIKWGSNYIYDRSGICY